MGEWMNDDKWYGSYFGNNCQEITDEDANNLAEALEKALETISRYSNGEIELFVKFIKVDLSEFDAISEEVIQPWSGSQELIKDFVKLFKSGSCQIF